MKIFRSTYLTLKYKFININFINRKKNESLEILRIENSRLYSENLKLHSENHRLHDENKLFTDRYNRIHKFVDQAIAVVSQNLENTSFDNLKVSNNIDSKLGKAFDLFGSDKNNAHSYASVYETILEKNDEPRILEIGIGTKAGFAYGGLEPAGALRAFKHTYPSAQIYGADIDKDAVEENCDAGKLFYVNQLIRESLGHLKEQLLVHTDKFDLIIDDGFHEINANVNTLIELFELLDESGTYVIEDVHVSMVNLWKLIAVSLNLQLEILDMTNLRPDSDDNILLLFSRNKLTLGNYEI